MGGTSPRHTHACTHAYPGTWNHASSTEGHKCMNGWGGEPADPGPTHKCMSWGGRPADPGPTHKVSSWRLSCCPRHLHPGHAGLRESAQLPRQARWGRVKDDADSAQASKITGMQNFDQLTNNTKEN